MQLNGFIKLHRKMLYWEWYDDVVVKTVFIHILLRCSYTDFSWHGKQFYAGQYITSVAHLSEETHLTVAKVRNALSKLSKSGEITKHSTNEYTVITVKNWFTYQTDDKQNTNDYETENNQTATSKEKKNKRKKDNPHYISPKRGRKRDEGAYDLELFKRMANSDEYY